MPGLLLLLIILIGIVIFRRIIPGQYKPWVLIPVLTLGLLLLLANSPLGMTLANQGLLWGLPLDTGSPAEAIVILGRGPELRDQRVETAIQLWQNNRAPTIFASGARDALEITNQLKLNEIPGSRLGGELCSQTTEENAMYSEAILKSRGIHNIILVTDAPHMIRAFWEFQRLGFEVIPHPSPFPDSFSQTMKTRLMMREYSALLAYKLIGHFNQSVQQPIQSGLLDKLSIWNCRVEG